MRSPDLIEFGPTTDAWHGTLFVVGAGGHGRLFVVGAGGHGRDVADIAEACGWGPVVFLDGLNHDGVVGRPHELAGKSWPTVIAVNDPAARARLAVGGKPATLTHPTAVVSDTAKLGPGVVVGANACIGPKTRIGAHTHIGAGSTITRTTLGEFCSVAPGVDIAGDVIVGDGTLIGVGARVANLVHVGSGATVGAGAVVVRDVPPGWTVAGVPARRL